MLCSSSPIAFRSFVDPFLPPQGPLTSPQAASLITEAMNGELERTVDVLFYRKTGESR